MAESLIKIVDSVFQIWNRHDKNKYKDEWTGLKKEYYAEYVKPQEIRSDAILDDVLLRMRIFGDRLSAAIGNADAAV